MKRLFMVMAIVFATAGMAAYGQTKFSAAEEAVVRADMAKMELLDETIPMRFGSAVDLQPIVGAEVVIAGIGTFITDKRGIIKFAAEDVADGNYSLVFNKEGYVSTPINFRIQFSKVLPYNWFAISPVLQGDFRFVLEWGSAPSDLDLHFEKAGGYHIAYWNTHNASDGSAQLDRDDTTSYGPETITVKRADAASVYTLYVIDYSDISTPTSAVLSQSGARVSVYNGTRYLKTFTVPRGAGVRWNVFKIVNGALVDVNTITRN